MDNGGLCKQLVVSFVGGPYSRGFHVLEMPVYLVMQVPFTLTASALNGVLSRGS